MKALWTAILLVVMTEGAASAADRPNILVILADDLGYGDLSSYGANDLRTPRIDRLAESGMRFDRFYANSPVCSPTRAALLTGRFPDLVGVPGVIRTHRDDNWGSLSDDARLFPVRLKEAGYRTAIVGKWHLGLEEDSDPIARGFDFFHGFLGDMMDDYSSHRRHGINYMRLNRREIDPAGHATDLFTDWAIDWLRRSRQESGPWFLYLAYNAPHTPIQPPSDWLERIRREHPGLDDRRAKLVALIEHLDWSIGRVLDELDRLEMSDETLIVFTSDNGGQLTAGANNGPLRGGKQDMFEGGIRVPTAVSWPGRIEPGSRSDRVLLSMDLFPTLCAAAGAEAPAHLDGISFLPTLLGNEPEPEDRVVVWVRREGGSRYGGRTYYAVRAGSYKLLQNTPFEPMRLYDLEADPGETTPLPEDHPQYRRLFDALQNHVSESGAIPWQRDR